MTPVPASLGFVEGVAQPLEKRFEVIKDVGDGSFGSVVLARVRGTRNMVPFSQSLNTHTRRVFLLCSCIDGANFLGRDQVYEKIV